MKVPNLLMRAKARFSRILLQAIGELLASRWILVFQMGKVGSLNMVQSLKLRLGLTPVFHLHVLSEKQISRMNDLIQKGIEVRRHRALVEYANRVRTKLISGAGPRKKIISLVRDPVAQMIATTMSEYVDSNPNVLDKKRGPNLVEESLLHEFFMKRLEYEYEFIALWFDTEIRDLYGIDVFATPFPIEKGYTIWQADKADLLLLRLEDLDRCHREAIGVFLKLPDFELVGANRAEDKGPDYTRAYLEFKSTIALPEELLDKLYSIRWVKHFYSEAEILSFKARWQNRHLSLAS